MKMSVATTHAIAPGSQPAAELVRQVRDALGPRPIELAMLFVSAQFEHRVEQIAFETQQVLGARSLIGLTCETSVAGAVEFEGQPTATLWAAHMPGAASHTFHVSQEELAAFESAAQVAAHVGAAVDDAPSFILLADPFSIDAVALLAALETTYPGRPAVGGMASAGAQRGENRVIFEGQALREGAVGVALWGNVTMDTIVSQGCRPIGQHAVITSGARNIIHELGGRPTLEVVAELLGNCDERDRELAQARGLLIGRVLNEHQGEFNRGDFLIRNPLAFDRQSGAMKINDVVRTGQTVQFHVRDAASATEDLAQMLEVSRCGLAAGALLFTCNGRGTRLFDSPSHDAGAVAEACEQPLAGCSCAGEIGPIGGRNYVHGHTVSVAFFRPAGG